MKNCKSKLSALLFIFSITAILLFFLSPNILANQDISKPDQAAYVEPTAVNAYVSRLELAAGEEFQVLLNLDVDNEWHVNSNKPFQDYMIPTAVTNTKHFPR